MVTHDQELLAQLAAQIAAGVDCSHHWSRSTAKYARNCGHLTAHRKGDSRGGEAALTLSADPQTKSRRLRSQGAPEATTGRCGYRLD
jgi:hypothetical protein